MSVPGSIRVEPASNPLVPSSDVPPGSANVREPTMAGKPENSAASLQTLPCVHCNEPTPCTAEQDPDAVFCCNGCLGAYQLIHGWGLEDFYALREQMKLSTAPRPAEQGGRFEQFDSETFLGSSAPKHNPDGTCSVELALHGLHCAACAWLIEKAAANEPGWMSARVRMNRHTLHVIYDPEKTRLSRIARMLDRLGYQLAAFDPGQDDHLHKENRRHLIHIAIAGFLAANAMWIAVGLYAGEFSSLAPEHRYFLTLVGTALGLAAVAWPGRTFLVGGMASLRTWTPHMDLPIALGLLVGSIVGSLNAIRGAGHVYFDSMAVLVFLLLIGRWIQFRQQQTAARAVDLMLRITPRHCNVLRADQQQQTVLVDTLVAGDIIRVEAGESIAADGRLVAGTTTLDRSLLTGESLPVSASEGDDVSAGVVNVSSPIQVEVSAVGRDSRIGQVMQSVEAAAMQKTPIVMLADKVGGYFVVCVLGLAIATFAVWVRYDLAAAASHATALLIVACPCALALATPLAIAVGLGKAARGGILVRDGQALQKLSRPGKIWLDKTGTLTLGKQRVTSLHGSEHGLEIAAALEAGFRHPVATAIEQEADRRQLNHRQLHARDATALPGGATGRVADQEVRVGNWQLMNDHNCQCDKFWLEHAEALVDNGQSPIFIAVDGQVETLLGISDPLRDNAAAMVHQLRQMGWSVGILSGDHADIVQRVGGQVGIAATDCTGGMSPEAKLKRIEACKVNSRDSVVMVGDGANDAAALARADVGIAVRGGAEVSLQAAPVFIASGKLESIPNLMAGARRTSRLIYRTFAISLLYNLVAVGLAMAGWISPFAAALLMPASSVTVLAVTLAAKTFPDRSPP